MRSRFWIAAGVLLCAVGAWAQALHTPSTTAITIEPQEKWRAVFGGKEYAYTFRISSAYPYEGIATWGLQCEGLTLMRGESPCEAGPEKAGLVEVHFTSPPIKEGVVAPFQLSLALFQPDKEKALASWEETFYAFPGDPFAFERKRLKRLEVGLYDTQGTTKEVFKELDIPFRAQSSLDMLAAFSGSLLVIGGGTRFSADSNLWDEIVRLSTRRNIPVLILAPCEGSIPLPGSEGGALPGPFGMTFRRREVIRKLDKRLDSEAWPPDGKIVISSMELTATKTGVRGEFAANEEGWAWCELETTGKGGRILISGFAIVHAIKAGPSPRYLLARLFDYLTEDKDTRGFLN